MSAPGYGEHDDEPLPAAGYRTYEVYQRERVAESSNLLAPRELIGDEMLDGAPPAAHHPARAPSLLPGLGRQPVLDHPLRRRHVGVHRRRQLRDTIQAVVRRTPRVRPRSACRAPRAVGRREPDRCARRTDRGADARRPRRTSPIWHRRSRPGCRSSCGGRCSICPKRICPSSPRGTGGCSEPPAGTHAVSETGTPQRSSWSPTSSPSSAERRADPGDDLISAAATVELDGPTIDATDIVATIWEADHETLHGGLANLWFQLLTNPEQLDAVRDDRRLVKFAWLETLRHSPPVHSAVALRPSRGRALRSSAPRRRPAAVFGRRSEP